ncbi:MAG: hypothetical protein M3N13_06455 [Candidatus Eremiobacteraeota bacterium]|nr:hypothetical protein [Candidatus Eremiobacteraeota bacterium]
MSPTVMSVAFIESRAQAARRAIQSPSISSNAFVPAREWGHVTREAPLVAGVQKAFEWNWHDAGALVGAIDTNI